jgi:hypothetical protein
MLPDRSRSIKASGDTADEKSCVSSPKQGLEIHIKGKMIKENKILLILDIAHSFQANSFFVQLPLPIKRRNVHRPITDSHLDRNGGVIVYIVPGNNGNVPGLPPHFPSANFVTGRGQGGRAAGRGRKGGNRKISFFIDYGLSLWSRGAIIYLLIRD